MRLCVSCVYWTLLLVSVVSSGLLFLIVASEGTQVSEKPRGISRQEVLSREDVSEDTDGGYSEPVDNKVPDARARPTVNAKKEHSQPVSDERLSSGESYGGDSKSENNLNVVKQSLTPQPNLSQGVSEYRAVIRKDIPKIRDCDDEKKKSLTGGSRDVDELECPSDEKIVEKKHREKLDEEGIVIVVVVVVTMSSGAERHVALVDAPICPNSWMEETTGPKLGSPRHLFRAVLLYLTVLAALWCVPACLYHRISETGQAVVLTLIDTAAAELQSLAEPRLTSETRSRSSPKNVSVRTTTTGPVPATTASTTATASFEVWKHEAGSTEGTTSHTSTSPTVPLAPASASNATKILPSTEETSIDEDNASTRGGGPAGDVETTVDDVVVVRAEQKSLDKDDSSTIAKKPEDSQRDEVKDETVKHEENLTVPPELDDGATRAKLVAGGGDESAAVILDGLVTTGPTDHHQEDIPSFSEWAQKRLEEAEKKKTHPNASIQNPGGPGRGLGGLKVRSKNYASPDCGAKIVAVNPEARSARSVLVSTRDEYMLNTCTSRVWFVVELCEAIQAKKIELANFELFSSSPKDFSVYVSDRFPTRDWSPVGQFTARDQRDIQSFNLSPHLFGKFIKVELHSHYGSEHFCPISLFRAYGTSEFEVLETETDHQDSDDEEDDSSGSNDEDEDEALDAESSDAETRNLFGSARDAVLRIVKKAAEVLVKTGDPSNKNNITKIQESIEDSITGNSFASCMTPRYTINCANCTDARFAGVFELLNCRAGHLDDILRVPFLADILVRDGLCSSYGFDTLAKSGQNDSSLNGATEVATTQFSRGSQSSRLNFLASIYSPEYILALCNVIATKDQRVVLNTSYESSEQSSVNSSTRIEMDAGKFEATEAVNGQPRIASAKNLCNPELEGPCKPSGLSEAKIPSVQVASAIELSTMSNSSANATTTTSTTSIATATTSSARTDSLAAQIRPTRALSREDLKKDTNVPILEAIKDHNDQIAREILTTPSPAMNVATASSRAFEESQSPQNNVESTSTHDFVASPNRDQDPPARHEGHDNGTPRQDHSNEQETKTLNDNGEHEAKLMAQDQMSLDSILSDLKDLEGDHGNANQNANVVAQPTASTPQQKESVFLRLSNRIKALERNMSLSGQYLEELSKRYKKQVEEMQRSLERATSAMSEESRKGEERELRRIEEISALREEITSLTQSLDILLYDRNSWRSKLSTVCQHFVLVVVEIVVFVFVVTYCRRSSEFEDVDADGDVAMTSLRNEVARRRSTAGATTSYGVTKKARKRRPSEIAARIGGTYRELMIEDRHAQESKRKDKKKRRKRESNVDGRKETSSLEEVTAPNPLTSRRSSSTDHVTHAKQLQLRYSRKRPDSAPEYSGLWNDDRIDETFVPENSTDATSADSPFSPEDRPPSATHLTSHEEQHQQRDSADDKEQEKTTGVSLFRGAGILRAKLSSPSFMKTALGARNKRAAKQTDANEIADARTASDDWDWYSRNSSNRSDSGSPTSLLVDQHETVSNGQEDTATRNGRHRGTESESGGSSNATPNAAIKKDKKTTRSIRKMVRKLF